MFWKDFELKIPWGQPRAGSSPAPSIYQWGMLTHSFLAIETNCALVYRGKISRMCHLVGQRDFEKVLSVKIEDVDFSRFSVTFQKVCRISPSVWGYQEVFIQDHKIRLRFCREEERVSTTISFRALKVPERSAKTASHLCRTHFPASECLIFRSVISIISKLLGGRRPNFP